ncbi:MAG TPA: hypothetical protein VNW50_21510 [Streptosporangiaceae bacterium]|nr:hypothetical protein [Streptosporangiaceae bacterium]
MTSLTEVPRLSAALLEAPVPARWARPPAICTEARATLPDQLPAGLRSKPSALPVRSQADCHDPRTTTEDRPKRALSALLVGAARDVYLYVI